MDSSLGAKLFPEDAQLSGDCGVLIPAFNEEAGVAVVLKVALASNLGPVLVVDDGSNDQTTNIALKAGANVLKLAENQGKGGAVYAGARILDTRVILMLDADLTGLTTKHLVDLANPVLKGDLDMTRGIFTGGRFSTTAAQQLAPYLNGQRALLREKLLALPNFKEARFGIEVIITRGAEKHKWRWQDVPLKDVSQVMKEEKRGFWMGVNYRIKMYYDLISTWFRSKENRKKKKEESY